MSMSTLGWACVSGVLIRIRVCNFAYQLEEVNHIQLRATPKRDYLRWR